MFCVQLDTATNEYASVDCSVSSALMVLSPLEVAQQSPFYLDPQSAIAISGAMLVSFAVAFVIRMAAKALGHGSKDPESE